MKKILVLVLALLCVFAVSAVAEEAFQPEFGTHHFYANTAEAKAMADYKGYTATTYAGWYDQKGTLVSTPNYLAIFGETAANCEVGATYTFKCADENCTDADKLVTVTVSEPQHTNLTVVENDPRNKAPKCDEKGAQVYKCDLCGEFVVDIPMIPHSYAGPEAEVVTAPTCTEDGYITFNCDFCDESHTEKAGDALGHNFTKYELVVIKPATCLEAGKAAYLRVCENEGCNATEEGLESYYFDLPIINHLDATANEWLQLYLDANDEVIFDDRFDAGFDFVDKNGDGIVDVNAQGIPYVENVNKSAVSALLTGTKYAVVTGAGEDGLFGTADDVETKVQLHGDYTFTYTEATCEDEGSLVIACKNCGASVTYAIEAKGHKYEIKKINNAAIEDYTYVDCTKGYKVYVECVQTNDAGDKDICDEAFQQNTIVCDAHDVDSFKLTQKLGNNSVVEEGPFAIELFDEKVAQYMVDCLPYTVTYYCDCELQTASGIVVVNPATCDYEFDDVVPATEDHTIDWASDKVFKYVAATCKAPGYVLYTCSECFTPGRVDFEIDEDAHDFENIEWTTTPAECEKDGLKSGVCPLCENTLEQVIPMTGHDWDHEEEDYTKWAIEPKTCTKDGKYYRTCATCKTEEKVVIPAGHTYPTKADGSIDAGKCVSYTPSTCSTNGSISYYCTVCHEPVANQQLPKLPHDMKEIKVVYPKTCCVGTQKLYGCDLCGAKEVRVSNDALGHKASDINIEEIKKVIKAGTDEYTHVIYLEHATCTTPGKGYQLCATEIKVYAYDETSADLTKVVDSYTCDYEYEFEIEAFGHAWEVVEDEDGTFYCECPAYKVVGQDEFGNDRYGCGATDKIEVRAPLYEISIEGKVGTLTKADDNMSDLQVPVYVRIVYDFQTKDGVSTSLIFMAEVDMTNDGGTFKVPVIKTGMTMTGSSFIVVTDADADELRYSQITNKYGELNL